MNYMTRVLYFFLFASSPVAVYAVDIPSVDEGSAGYNQEMCIEETTNNCIDTICLTSSAIDCEDQCRSDATDKCQQLADE